MSLVSTFGAILACCAVVATFADDASEPGEEAGKSTAREMLKEKNGFERKV